MKNVRSSRLNSLWWTERRAQKKTDRTHRAIRLDTTVLGEQFKSVTTQRVSGISPRVSGTRRKQRRPQHVPRHDCLHHGGPRRQLTTILHSKASFGKKRLRVQLSSAGPCAKYFCTGMASLFIAPGVKFKIVSETICVDPAPDLFPGLHRLTLAKVARSPVAGLLQALPALHEAETSWLLSCCAAPQEYMPPGHCREEHEPERAAFTRHCLRHRGVGLCSENSDPQRIGCLRSRGRKFTPALGCHSQVHKGKVSTALHRFFHVHTPLSGARGCRLVKPPEPPVARLKPG